MVSRWPAAFPSRLERQLILLLCLVAAVHAFVFSAAFPFFNNVDELAHFDLVLKYSHGEVPRGIVNFSAEAAGYMALYSSSAYFGKAGYFPDGKFPPPPWTQPIEKIRPILFAEQAAWRKQENYEASEPPLYYGVAAVWWDFGKWIGLQNGRLLYWLRFLNLLVVAALVWLGYLAVRLVFPEDQFIRLGVPALLAFFPQTAFYSIENDGISSICFGAAFVLLLKWLRAENPGAGSGSALGIALGATFLAKMTNLPLLAVSGMAISFKTWNLAKSGRERWPGSFVSLCLCTAIPVCVWMIWCKHYFGDLTGSEFKASFFGWKLKAFDAWWQHPIFTPAGFWTFISSLLATFWQSEFLWHGEPLHSPAVDLVYVILSLCCVSAALVRLKMCPKTMPPAQRQALWLAFWCFAAAVCYLAVLSIIFDFGYGHNPSRERPYFTAGRMILGVVIPFMLLFLFGLESILCRLNFRFARIAALAVMVLFMLTTEVAVDWHVFSNEYNWFHLP